MRPDILIVGQGIAGTLLAWALERAGLRFAIAEAGDGRAASRAGAGILNPITGRRLTKSWRAEAWLPFARTTYRQIETALGVPVWHELRVRRLFADARERAAYATKQARGDLAPFVRAAEAGGGEAAAEGFWIEGAGRVDVPALLQAARRRWQAAGRWRDAAVQPEAELGNHALVIDCRGLAGARREGSGRGSFSFVPWEHAKGEVLELAVEGLEPGVILNRRHWVLPVGAGVAWVGATHEPGVSDPTPTSAGRAALEASARDLLGGRAWRVAGQRAGVRVTLGDKRPVVGRHPEQPKLGIVNGLGAKGALLAPALAQQWVNHVVEGAAFDPEMSVARFGG